MKLHLLIPRERIGEAPYHGFKDRSAGLTPFYDLLGRIALFRSQRYRFIVGKPLVVESRFFGFHV